MSVLKTISRTIVVACALASPLHAQAPTTETPVTIWDAFSLENFLKFAVQSTMPSLRALADIRYDQIDVDPVRNRIALIGADIRPFLPYIDNDGCVITADALVLSGQPVDRQQGFALSFALDGVVVDFDCLPREARPVIGLMGVEDIRMDRATLDVNYDFASGGATLHLGADFDELASLSGSADLDYISYRINLGGEDVMPAADINHIQVTLEDRGLFTAASRIAPPGMLDPEGLAQIIPQALAEMFGEMNGLEAGDLSEEQQAFISQAVQVAQDFVAKPSQIVLETALTDAPVRFDETDIENPKALFSKLALAVSTTPKAITTGISSADLQNAMDGLLPIERNLDVGRALLTGVGAPRNHPLGLSLLDPLAKEGNPQASALMAAALQNTDPAAAYSLAIHAASNGQSRSLSLLNELENALTFSDVLAVQDEFIGADGPLASDFASIGDIRRAARGHLLGTTRARSYRAAYYWASVGAATGDIAAAAIRDDIDTMIRLRGANAVWSDARTSIENAVLRDWVGLNLKTSLRE